MEYSSLKFLPSWLFYFYTRIIWPMDSRLLHTAKQVHWLKKETVSGAYNELEARKLTTLAPVFQFVKTTRLITLPTVTMRWLSTIQYQCIKYYIQSLRQFFSVVYVLGLELVNSTKLYYEQNILMFSFQVNPS